MIINELKTISNLIIGKTISFMKRIINKFTLSLGAIVILFCILLKLKFIIFPKLLQYLK
jgi:hypothetical protein